ncbi:NAD-dependent succinate-semialdehyde dehydrogenase [Comamonas sp. UBA7528]|uniref:NAD-dependent succinate-semialdehyde dehydrogenase n=1 Tax=Comamonas sp. UBA7528 TaxID=1946391 RepID=UPI0025C3C92F|nr:NAD-dependent succinate-semialdehyde dehydrogenase [Comamonas sp. UBA7528]
MFNSINPATEAQLGQFSPDEPAHIDQALDLANKAQREWRRLDVNQRTPLLRQLALTLRKHKGEWARLITLEMGKPLSEALAEVEKCAVTCDFYAEHATRMLSDTSIESNASDSRIVHDPLGIVLAVMPWNYPFWQAMRAAVPAIVAGNGLFLKHAANVPQCARALEALFVEAGAPPGLFTAPLLPSSAVEGLINDERIAAVTFTGSTPVGRTIASQAGNALKKQVLELGGSDPFVVLADADVEAAAAAAVKARFSNTGQSCISSKRFIVEETIADRFVEAFCNGASKLVQGDPLNEGVGLGPMARGSLRDELHAQIAATVAEGAQLKLGGELPSGPGYFYPATVLDHVTPNMTAAKQETFGPAAAILRVRDTEEAIALANATEFGLGATLWTKDASHGRALARHIDAGAVFINGLVASDPRLPFGGVKQSGYGRELGAHGLHEFTNVKTLWSGPAR